jgi:hypothetical protein
VTTHVTAINPHPASNFRYPGFFGLYAFELPTSNALRVGDLDISGRQCTACCSTHSA